MSYVLPFSIDGYTFTDTASDDDLSAASRSEMSREKDRAMGVWRTDGWGTCLSGQKHMAFSVEAPNGEHFGTWMLYRVRPTGEDPNRVSALLAPMFPDIDAKVVSEARTPTGELINGDQIAESEARSSVFWRRNFAFMEWQFMNSMPMSDGEDFVVDHWRFPQTSDGDPSGQCWVDLESVFASYSKLDVDWNNHMPGMGPCPIRTTGWKTVDPDPSRARGSVNP